MDYDAAYRMARRDKKLLLIYFDPHPPVHTAASAQGVAKDAIDRALVGDENRDRLGDYVFARLPTDATYERDKSNIVFWIIRVRRFARRRRNCR